MGFVLYSYDIIPVFNVFMRVFVGSFWGLEFFAFFAFFAFFLSRFSRFFFILLCFCVLLSFSRFFVLLVGLLHFLRC